MFGFFIKMKKRFLALVLFFYIGYSHPMPNSVLIFDVKSDKIYCELQLPLKELQLAIPFDVTNDLKDLFKNHREELYKYVLNHFSIKGKNHEDWDILIDEMKLAKAEQTATGVYQELIISMIIVPKDNYNIRNFIIYYDAIMHQVVTHKTIVTVRQDWENGQVGEKNTEIATIATDTRIGKVLPLQINLAKGNSWKGFKSMLNLGMAHIAEGTDHLLFLLVLLLSAPLIAENKNWSKSGGTKYSLIRILKITLAFTFGHSITLFLGSFGWIHVQQKPIEILIAFSILITAIHAIRPIFANKEIYIASGFGLIHGLAFASVLAHLNLDTVRLVISLFGFNLGIEIMQLFIILLVMPWLIILSSSKIYNWIRLFGAALAGIASISWMIERYYEKSNFISEYVQKVTEYSLEYIFGLALFTLIYIAFSKKSIQKLSEKNLPH